MCAKKRHRTSRDFLHYLRDELSKQERHELERDLETDPFEKEAMEGLESISPEKAEEDILSLHASMQKRLRRRKRVAWYSVAATAASILIVGTIFLNIYDLNPEEAEREALTEETFRFLDSDNEKSGPGEETLMEETPLDKTPIKETPSRETPTEIPPGNAAEPINSTKSIARAIEPVPAQTKNVSPSKKQDAEQDTEQTENLEVTESMEVADDPEATENLQVMEFSMADEAAPREKSSLAKKRSKSLKPESLPSQAPSREVSGIVVSSEDMGPLPGANIVIRGTNSGTMADLEGRFTLPADDSQTTVIASFIGMETREYQLKNGGNNQLVLQPDAVTLDEVVIVAQGSERLSGVNLSSSKISETDIATPSYIPAEPVGGFRELKNYIEQNMLFPDKYTPGERKVVILRFKLLSSGSITDIQTLRTPGEPFTLEAIRLIQEGPEWTPARNSNGPIDEQVRIRIVFKK